MTDAKTEAFVTDLMSRMTLEEKVGQTIQADIASIKPEDLLTYPLGSILAGGNPVAGGDERASAQAWVELAQAFRAAAAQRPGAQGPADLRHRRRSRSQQHRRRHHLSAQHRPGRRARPRPDPPHRRGDGAGSRGDRRRLDLRPYSGCAAGRPLGPRL
jgi:hypothetical protein